MTEEEAKRKLTTILSADVKGYSRLMADDEEATVRMINDYRELMLGLIKDHRGQVVDAKGDNVLADFSSVVDAVRCAVQVQKELADRNSELPEHRKMEFRIGINLGDVIDEQGTIYGDGVNVAARLEGLAEGGGICISGTAFDQVKNRISVGYEYQGKQSVKNIPDPVRVYRVLLEPEAAGKVIGEEEPILRKKRWAAMVVVAVLALVAGGLLWNFYLRPDVEPTSVDKMPYPLPDEPSIAVLPFVNMSGSPEQEYFSDGITEEIITALSKTPKLLVIARNSAFTYKGKPIKVQQVWRELGVKYVLEGSVRKSEDQVRITAQLVDAQTGSHLWAERYDRELQDIFAVQDEITLEIIKAMQVELTMGETARVTGRGTKNLDAYLSALHAQEEWLRLDKEGSIKARQLASEAIAQDPEYGYPYAILAWCYMLDVVRHYSGSPDESMNLAVEAIQKALALDPSDHRIHRVLSNLYVMQGKHNEAIASSKRALELCPGGAGAYENLGIALLFACRPIEAIPMLQKAIQLDPFPPAVCHRNLAMAYCHVGRYQDAIEQGEKAFQINRNDLSTPFVLVLAYTKLGRKEQARATVAEILRIDPEYTLDSMAETRARMFAKKCHLERVSGDIEFIRNADVGLK